MQSDNFYRELKGRNTIFYFLALKSELSRKKGDKCMFELQRDSNEITTWPLDGVRLADDVKVSSFFFI